MCPIVKNDKFFNLKLLKNQKFVIVWGNNKSIKFHIQGHCCRIIKQLHEGLH